MAAAQATTTPIILRMFEENPTFTASGNDDEVAKIIFKYVAEIVAL